MSQKLTDDEFQQLELEVGGDTFNKAEAGDSNAISMLETTRDKILANRERLAAVTEAQKTIDYLDEGGNYNWDIIRTKLNVNLLSKKMVKRARDNGYDLSKNFTGSRFYNVGLKKDFSPFAKNSTEVGDMFNEVLKGPDSWWKSTAQDLIREQLGEEQETRREQILKYGEESDSVGQTKQQAISESAAMRQAEEKWSWFPKQMERDENGQMVSTEKELTRYLDHLKAHDPFTYNQFQQLDSTQEQSEFLLKVKEDDVAMYQRLQELSARGGNAFSDPEVFDWFSRRGMMKKPPMDIWEAAKAGGGVIVDAAKGTPSFWKETIFDMTRANVAAVIGGGAAIFGKGKGLRQFAKDQYSEAGEVFRASKEAVAGDFQILGAGAKALIDDKLINRLHINRDTPEGEEEFRKASTEIHRQYMLQAMENQAMWQSISFDLASKFWKSPQAMERMILAGSFILDPTNPVDLATMGGSAAVKQGAKLQARVAAKGSVKTLKGQLDNLTADLAVKQTRAIQIGQRFGVESPASVAAREAAKEAAEKVTEISAKYQDEVLTVTREIEEAAQAGRVKWSGVATEKLAKTAGTIIEVADNAIHSVAKVITRSDETAKTLDPIIRGALGGFAFGPFGMIVGGGSTALRSFLRDIEKIGSYVALGSRMTQIQRALRQSDEVAGEVVRDAVSKPTQALLSVLDIPMSIANLPGIRQAVRAPGRAVSTALSRDGLKSAAFQGALGYIGSAGELEGAITGAAMGTTLAASFGGVTSFMPVADMESASRIASQNARHFRKMVEGTPIGDQFNKLTHDQQKMVAWSLGGYPDMGLNIFRDENNAGGAWFNRDTGEMNINLANKDWEGQYAANIIQHETNHFLATHPGIREKMMNTLLGDFATGRAGFLAKTGDQGKLKGILDDATIGEITRLRETGETDSAIASKTGLSELAVRTDGNQLLSSDLRRDDVSFEMSDDFKRWETMYLEKFLQNNPEAFRRFSQRSERYRQEYMVEEFFVEQGVDRSKINMKNLSKYRQSVWKAGLDKLYNSEQGKLLKALQVGRLGALLDSSGKIKSRIFGDVHKINAIQAVFDGYAKDRSMGITLDRESQASGSTLSPENIQDPVKQDATLKEWAASGRLNVDPATGVPKGVKVNADGTWEVVSKRDAFRTAKEQDAEAKAFAEAILEWADENGPDMRSGEDVATELQNDVPPQTPEQSDAFNRIVEVVKDPDATKSEVKSAIQQEKASSQAEATTDYLKRVGDRVDDIMPDAGEMAWRTTIDGKELFTGRYMSDALLEKLESSGQWNPHQLDNLRLINAHLREESNAIPITIMYQAATRAGRYKSIRAYERTIYVTGFDVTRQGNLIYRGWNLDKALANGVKKLKTKIGKELYDGPAQLQKDIQTFFNNHAKGLPGATGIGIPSRDFIRKALGLGDPKTSEGSGRTVNPYNHRVMALADPRQGDSALNSFRLDSTNWVDLNNPRNRAIALDRPLTSEEGGRGGSYQRIRENYYPGENDARYMELAQDEELNRDILQRMVDLRAREAGWTPKPMYHGTGAKDLTQFDYQFLGQNGRSEGAGFYFTDDKGVADGYGRDGKVVSAYLRKDRFIDADTPPSPEQVEEIIQTYAEEYSKTEDAIYDELEIDDILADIYYSHNGESIIDMQGDLIGQGLDAESVSKAIAQVMNIDGFISKGFSGEGKAGGEIHVVLESRFIKESDLVSRDKSGNVIPLSERFNPASDDIRFFPGTHLNYETWKKDQPPASEEVLKLQYSRYVESTPEPVYTEADYMELAKDEELNRDILQRMVDAAAKRAGYDSPKVYHGSLSSGFNVFKIPDNTLSLLGRALYFTDDVSQAKNYASLNPSENFDLVGKIDFISKETGLSYREAKELLNKESTPGVYSVFLRTENFRNIRKGEASNLIKRAQSGQRLDFVSTSPYTGFEFDQGTAPKSGGAKHYMVFDPTQIKSADPVTYDKDGNIIPLSERFDPSSDDIRYSPGVDDTRYMDLAKDPEGNREELTQLNDRSANLLWGTPVIRKGYIDTTFAQQDLSYHRNKLREAEDYLSRSSLDNAQLLREAEEFIEFQIEKFNNVQGVPTWKDWVSMPESEKIKYFDNFKWKHNNEEVPLLTKIWFFSEEITPKKQAERWAQESAQQRREHENYKKEAESKIPELEAIVQERPEYRTGNPFTVVAFHGNQEGGIQGNVFGQERLGAATGAPSAKKGYFFAGEKSTSQSYASDNVRINHIGFLRDVPAEERGSFVEALQESFYLEMQEEKQRLLEDFKEDSLGTDAFEDYLDKRDLLDPEVRDMDEYIEENPWWVKAEAEMMYDIDYSTDAPVPTVMEFYVHMDNPMVVDQKGDRYRETSYNDLLIKAKKQGHDGLVIENTYDGGGEDNIFVVLKGHENQIKSADPVTYDKDGNAIPLSKRFNPASDDIRYSPGVSDYNPIAMPTQDGRSIEIRQNDKFTIKPPMKSINSLKGESVILLEADRHDTLDGRMGGPMFPYLHSSQVTATTPDGKTYKPGWANMNASFVTGTKNKVMNNTTNGHALVHIMTEHAHRSNRHFVQEYLQKVDKMGLSPELTDLMHVSLWIGSEVSRIEIEKQRWLIKEKKREPDPAKRNPFPKSRDLSKWQREFTKEVSPIKSNVKRGNLESANKALEVFRKKHAGRKWFKDVADKYRNTSFADEVKVMSFNARGGAMSFVRGLPFLPSMENALDATMDFAGGSDMDIVGVVQLSRDPEAFAIYTGKDPSQEKFMSDVERDLLKQFRSNPDYKPHPSYDWMMLSPENADTFLLEESVHPETIFPYYRNAHGKKSVVNGSPQTVVGTMKKSSKIKLEIK